VEEMLEELDFIDKLRNFVALTEAAIKHVTPTRYNRKVRPKEFSLGDLVLRWARREVGCKLGRTLQSQHQHKNGCLHPQDFIWPSDSQNMEHGKDQALL